MYDNRSELLKMVQKYLAGKATSEEIQFLESYYDFFERGENVLDQLRAEEKILLEANIEAGINARIDLAERGNVRKMWRPWTRIAAAAVILIVLSFSAYFILHKQQAQQIANNKINDIHPGGNKAILTLGDGKQIVLTGAKNGKLAEQGATEINKTQDGQVVYTAGESPNSQLISYNTMSTPRGGQYHLVLADGTNVWLNAASSIKYPTAFAGKDRAVEITGEAYFEVAHNASKPFRVTANGQTVEVLGTHFNINAYGDEPVLKTTLFEGRVKVSKSGVTAILKPGQQAQIKTGGADQSIHVVNDANLEEALAWKNGYFVFDGEKLESIMRKVSRWYDVDVSYQQTMPDVAFGGTISRFENVSQLLDVLQRTGSVHFKVEGRRITVMK